MLARPPLLTDHEGYTSASGKVGDNTSVYVAQASSSHWSLDVGGTSAPRATAFDWANAFEVGHGGDGTLRFRTPLTRYALLALEVGLWVAAIVLWRRWRAPVAREADE